MRIVPEQKIYKFHERWPPPNDIHMSKCITIFLNGTIFAEKVYFLNDQKHLNYFRFYQDGVGIYSLGRESLTHWQFYENNA